MVAVGGRGAWPVLLLAVGGRGALIVPPPPTPDLLTLGHGVWDTYVSALDSAPVVSKALTAGTLTAVSDGIVQIREEGNYDRDRGVGFALFGMLYTGACQHHIFGFLVQNLDGSVLSTYPIVSKLAELPSVLPSVLPSLASLPSLLPPAADMPPLALNILSSLPILEAQELFAAAERTLVNQCVFIPMLYYPLFFVITALVRHLSPIEAWDFASKVYLPMLQRNLAFWIPIQFAQFALVPIDLQVLYACVAGVAWNIILSANAGKLSTSGSKDASEEDAVLAVERASNKGRLARSRG